MTELNDLHSRMAREFPHVDNERLNALLLDCYRTVARAVHGRRLDMVEELCRLHLTQRPSAPEDPRDVARGPFEGASLAVET